MNTIKVFSRPFLIPFVIHLVEVDSIGQGDYTIMFNCLAENYAHAVEQAIIAHPDAEISEYEVDE